MRHIVLQKQQQDSTEAAGEPVQALQVAQDGKGQLNMRLRRMRNNILQRQQQDSTKAAGASVQTLQVAQDGKER
eukprot:1161539-Pelagomonas_calceolata.AAC.7